MATEPVKVYGGVFPPQGVPVNLVHTAIGLAVEGNNWTVATLPMADVLPEGVFANTDTGLMRTKKGKWHQVKL